MPSRRRLLISVALISIIYAAGLFYFAHVRRVDGDEGYYTTAARLVWEGKTPYRDFFYQQAPLLPYLYSWIWGVHPRSLLNMRFLSVAFGALAVFLWGICLPRAERLPQHAALAAFVSILLNPYWFSWNVVVKTYAAANLLISVAIIAFYAAIQSARARWYFSAGIALGLAAAVRSLYGPLIPVVVIWTLLKERRTAASRYLNGLSLFAGAFCGLLPMIISFLRDSHSFFFNNVQYHHLDAGYIWQNGTVVTGYGGFSSTLFEYFVHICIGLLVFHPYFTIQIVLAVVGGTSLLRLKKSQESPYNQQDYEYLQLVLAMLVTYLFTALIPFPPYEQYFDSPLVPFLIPFVAEGLRVTFQAGPKRTVALALAAVVLFWFEVVQESAWNSMQPQWRVSSYEKVSERVQANSNPEDVVLSFWPGYVFASGRKYFPGMENNFSNRITNLVGPKERSRYHLVSKDQVTDAVSRRLPRLVVFASPAWMIEYYNNLSPNELESFRSAIDLNYAQVDSVDEIAIYRRRQP